MSELHRNGLASVWYRRISYLSRSTSRVYIHCLYQGLYCFRTICFAKNVSVNNTVPSFFLSFKTLISRWCIIFSDKAYKGEECCKQYRKCIQHKPPYSDQFVHLMHELGVTLYDLLQCTSLLMNFTNLSFLTELCLAFSILA